MKVGETPRNGVESPSFGEEPLLNMNKRYKYLAKNVGLMTLS